MREQSHAIPVEGWWLNLARRVIASDSRDYETLGADLAKHVKRKTPFTKATISKFVNGQMSATVDLAAAICEEFRIPRPVFFARSYEEAVHLEGLTERYARSVPLELDAPIVSLPPVSDRRRRKRGAATQQTIPAQPAAKKRAKHG